MDYRRYFGQAIDRLKAERRYRVFADLERDADRFPSRSGAPTWRRAGSRHLVLQRLSRHGPPPARDRGHADTAARKLGAGAGGTRNISGTNHPLVELEAELADLHGKQGALVFTSGWVSNHAAISTIAELLPNCLILSDALNHNSMIEGVRRSGCEKTIFRHNDVAHLEELLHGGGPRARQARSCSRASIRWTATSRRSARSCDLAEQLQRHDLYRRSPRRRPLRPARRRHLPSATVSWRRIDVIEGTLAKAFRHARRLYRRRTARDRRRGALLCAGLHLHHRAAAGIAAAAQRRRAAPEDLAGRARAAAAPGRRAPRRRWPRPDCR